MTSEVKPTLPVDKAPKVPVVPAAAVAGPVPPVKAVHRINGTIEPDTMFRPASLDEREELFLLDAVVDLTKDELRVFKETEITSDADLG